MLIKDIERQEIENILHGFNCNHAPELREATAEVCDYVNEKAKEIEIEITNPTLPKLTGYIEINIQKYWDKMGNTGGDEYFDNATQEELIALGQYKAFEKVQYFIEEKLQSKTKPDIVPTTKLKKIFEDNNEVDGILLLNILEKCKSINQAELQEMLPGTDFVKYLNKLIDELKDGIQYRITRLLNIKKLKLDEFKLIRI